MPCGHSSGLSNGSECAIFDPHFFHTVRSMLSRNLGFFHKGGMFSRQIHSSSEQPAVIVGRRQNRTHLSLQGEMPDQEGKALKTYSTNLCLGRYLEAEPLLDKLCVNATHSTETDFSTEVENNQENQYYYIVICLINYKSAWKILLNLYIRIIHVTIVPGLKSLS